MDIIILLVYKVITVGTNEKRFEKGFPGEVQTSETLKKHHEGEKSREEKNTEAHLDTFLILTLFWPRGRTIPFLLQIWKLRLTGL